MPIKSQLNSYRNKNGIKYKGYSDVFSKNDAIALVKELRNGGYKAFYEKGSQNEMYWRVFREVKIL